MNDSKVFHEPIKGGGDPSASRVFSVTEGEEVVQVASVGTALRRLLCRDSGEEKWPSHSRETAPDPAASPTRPEPSAEGLGTLVRFRPEPRLSVSAFCSFTVSLALASPCP